MKYSIIFIIILAFLISSVLLYKSYKLENNKEDIIKLVTGNLILINCGALISTIF